MNDDIKIEKIPKSYISEILVILAFIICGSIYGVYSIKQGDISQEIVKTYLFYKSDDFTIKELLFCFWSYCKKILIIFLISCFTDIACFVYVFIFMYIFAYGFSITALIGLFSIADCGKYLMLLIINGTIFIFYIQEIARPFIVNADNKVSKSSLYSIFIKGIIASGCMTIADIFFRMYF